MFSKYMITVISIAGLLGFPALVTAQEPPPEEPPQEVPEPPPEQQPEEPEPAEAEPPEPDEPVEPERLPPAEQPEQEPLPPVAEPDLPDSLVIRQAGVGSDIGYGRAGVLELGGFAGFTAAQDFTAVNINPTVGWFIADNVQLSGILGLSYASLDGAEASTTVSLLVEPSYHLPFTRSVFGFLGVGLGGAFVQGEGLGFAAAPRLGVNILVGRSGILSPAVSYQYTTQEPVPMQGGDPGVISTALQANIGYTVMW